MQKLQTLYLATGIMADNTLFTDVTTDTGTSVIRSIENDFIDFNIQKLLPHKFSEYGPALAVGDMDGNGLDDIVCGGSSGYSTTLLLQTTDGRFYNTTAAARRK